MLQSTLVVEDLMLEEQALGLELAQSLLSWVQQAEALVLGPRQMLCLLAWDLEQALALEQVGQGQGHQFPLGHSISFLSGRLCIRQ